MSLPTSWGSTLKAVRNPTVFNALAILLMAILVGILIRTDNLTGVKVLFGISGVLFIAGVTVWLNRFAAINPRFLAYGPDEYLKESKMEHERKMAKISHGDGGLSYAQATQRPKSQSANEGGV